ncbi:uncharacterized protein BX663DRAFT_349153 [Cokeromyces recurvatus]|uniref:uncharacterized protein n=1 Tax=Cokeromyces recurvatus TaxID=90255 RepID=UPI00222051FF|nr:uncharacterized protein BX663DRAFT_349153 [Cokeromyces recurvatus]KAI7903918.1 hypothetical protein BX663DRAFT_349153 [Cokeromyces recurvatus]
MYLFIILTRRLEDKTNTSITFNFDERYFDITGSDQEECSKAEQIICQNLLSRFNEKIDSNYMQGTFEDMSSLCKHVQMINENPSTPIPYHLKINGSVRLFEESDDEPAFSDHIPDQNEDYNNDENEGIISQIFVISPKIKNINSFLNGPPQHNMLSADYISIISDMTGASCSLNERNIRITGTENVVKNAYNRFHVLQKTFIGQLKTNISACIHYPTLSNHYGLYFCNLRNYKHKNFVHLQLDYDDDDVSNLYVMLPIFRNPRTNEYDPPKDMITLNSYYQFRKREEQIKKEKIMELNNTMNELAIATNTVKSKCQVRSSSSSSNFSIQSDSPPKPNSIQLTEITTELYRMPEWGMDRNFTSVYNTGKLEYLSSERLARAFTPPPPPPSSSIPLSADITLLLKDFPALTSTSRPSSPTSTASSTSSKSKYKPKLNLDKPKARRVMRIIPQKAAATHMSMPARILMDRVKNYNYNTIRDSLVTGLESVRGFKGEIRLSAKIGKVLWNVKRPEVLGKVWEYEEIKDIVMKELGTAPKFTKMTTMDEEIISLIVSNALSTAPYNKTSIYEFHCAARNQPNGRYKPVILYMNEGILDIRKVAINEKKVTEINWVSLDRKYDFQLSLTTKQLIRSDVKPFTTFNKWISISPITRLMSFQNVPKFLTVEHVILKQTTRYRSVFPFIVEVTRVERLCMIPVPGTQKINAQPGKGEAWYDFEIINTLYNTHFKANLDLEIGDEAPWTVEDILQTGTSMDIINSFVKCLLTHIEKIENGFKE